MGLAGKWWAKTKNYICLKEEPPTHSFETLQMLELARQELDSAYNLFSRAEDPDLIECAVYNLKAAEKRYDYLLKQTKIQLARTKKGTMNGD